MNGNLNLTLCNNFITGYSTNHLTFCVYVLSIISAYTVNCSDPTPPMNGSIAPYQNTTEGAEISFMCNPGFIPPAGRMRAVCGADGRWNPDPADLVCTCEY